MGNQTKFVIYTNNQDYPTLLERWKVYRVVADEKAENRNLIRIIDESGEDYLYSKQDFTAIVLLKNVEKDYLALA
jgi:hypothetical protein